jgi:molybdopterin-binding protein
VSFAPPERRGFAIVYQDYALFPHLSVRGNLAYGLRARKLARQELTARLNEVARRVGIAELLDRSPGTLSGGEQQRVALARAMVISPELLLLDEPLSAVDLQFRRVLRKLLRQLHQDSGTTFLHVTHDVEEAVQLGERIADLDRRMRLVSTPVELFSDKRIKKSPISRHVQHPGGPALRDSECSASGIPIRRTTRAALHIWIRPRRSCCHTSSFLQRPQPAQCMIKDWEMRDVLVAVRLTCGNLELSALITFASLEELQLQPGAHLYATFKSSAVRCF